MLSTCKKCGASIKNIVEIDGNIYGTSCAETVLGVKLPSNFRGDGIKFKDNLEKQKEILEKKGLESQTKFKKDIDYTIKGWNINIYFTNAYKKATSNWEREFILSCASQVTAHILTYLKKDGLSFDDAKREWNTDYMGSFPYRHYDLNDTFKNLSEKQLSILNRIYELPQ